MQQITGLMKVKGQFIKLYSEERVCFFGWVRVANKLVLCWTVVLAR